MNILIITGGRTTERLALDFFKTLAFEHIIVVDGALDFWDKVVMENHIPVTFDHLVGDFDTVSGETLEKYLENGEITVHRFNPVKDYTDTDIAVRLAMDLIREERAMQAEGMAVCAGDAGTAACEDGADASEPSELRQKDTIYLLGAMGTRMDHTLANLQMLRCIHDAGMEGMITDEHNRIRIVSGGFSMKKSELYGNYISLIPITDRLRGVTLEGFKYPLQGRDVTLGESLCVSNEITQEEVRVEIREGMAWLIESRD